MFSRGQLPRARPGHAGVCATNQARPNIDEQPSTEQHTRPDIQPERQSDGPVHHSGGHAHCLRGGRNDARHVPLRFRRRASDMHWIEVPSGAEGRFCGGAVRL